jgi:tRNA(Ile)-lysidine synthase
MRTLILPFLNENFGKTVTSGLVTLAKRSEELNGYLDEKVKPHFEAIKRGPFGLRWEGSLHPFELKHFLYKLFKAEGLPCRQQSINDLSHWMLEGKRDARLSVGSSIAYVDRGRFFLLRQETGAWRYSFSDSEEMGASSWEHVWEGKAWASLPHSDVELVRQPTSFFHKWWTGHKIPAVLRTKIPIVCEKGVPIHELLTGKYKKPHTPRKKIFLQFDESLAEDTFLC